MNNYMTINSKGESILFFLSPSMGIQYTVYDSNFIPSITRSLCNDEVLSFATTIDNADIVHILALMKSGQLNYYIKKKESWSKAVISKFDFKTNIYDNFWLFVENNNVNLIYSYANLINDKVWTIQHIVGDFNTWKKFDVINYISSKNDHSLHLNHDSFGSIHLIYSNNNKDGSQIYHTFYNPLANQWNQSPFNISNAHSNNILPYLFVDSKDNLHGLWLEGVIDSNVLKYAQFSSKSKEGYCWNKIDIPMIRNCYQRPIMIEENGVLKIIYATKDNIAFIYSSDYGNSWFKGDNVKIPIEDTKLIRIIIKSSRFTNMRINHAYCSINDTLNFPFIDSFKSLNNPLKPVDINMDVPVKHPQSQDKKDIGVEENELLKSQKEIKSMLIEIISSQRNLENTLEKIIKIIGEDKPSLFHKLFGPYNK